MAGYIDTILPAETQPEVYEEIRAEHLANGVPVSSWRSLVNVGLSLTQYVSEAFSTARTLARQVFRGMFVDSVQEDVAGATDAATLARVTAAAEAFALSQYQETADPATLALLRVRFSSVSTAAVQNLATGAVIVGTPSTTNPLLYTLEENVRLDPGGRVIGLCRAQSPGSGFNLASAAPFELKTTLAGVSAAVPSSGSRLTVGIGDSSLALSAGDNSTGSGLPIYFSIRSTGPSVPTESITFDGVTDPTQLRIYLNCRTNGASAILSTAEQGRQALVSGTNLDQFQGIQLPDGTDGTGVLATLALTAVPSADGPIEQAGQDQQNAVALMSKSVAKWDALEVGAGTDDALYYWGTKAPAGYTASPVSQIQVLTARKPDGTIRGGWITVLVSGDLGPLSGPDLAAVDANFYSPRKFAAFGRLATINATTVTITVTAAIEYLISSKLTDADIASAIEGALLSLQRRLTMGVQTIDPSLISSVCGDASPAIWTVALSMPAAPVTLAWNERPAFAMSGFTYSAVSP